MTNEAAQAGERDLSGDFVEHSHPQYGGGYFCTPDVFERVVALASLPAVQPAESGAIASKLAHHLQQAHTFVENTEAFGSPASHGIIQAGNDVACAWNIDESKAALADFAALSQPATTEAGDGVALTDARIHDLADDFKSQYKHGGTTFDDFDYLGFARSLIALATPVAAVAQPLAASPDDEDAQGVHRGVAAGFAAHGYRQGTKECIAFVNGARWWATLTDSQPVADAVSAALYPMDRSPWTEDHVKTYPCKAASIINAALAASPSCEQSAGSGCKGINCGTKTGDHSPECIAQHEAAYSSGNALDTPGNREPECRYMGYKGRPLGDGATDDQKAAWEEGRRAAIQPSERQDVGGDRG